MSKAVCANCREQLNGFWNMTQSGTIHEYTGRYLGITDGYFLYSGHPHWVNCYCLTCWKMQILALPFVNAQIDQKSIEYNVQQLEQKIENGKYNISILQQKLDDAQNQIQQKNSELEQFNIANNDLNTQIQDLYLQMNNQVQNYEGKIMNIQTMFDNRQEQDQMIISDIESKLLQSDLLLVEEQKRYQIQRGEFQNIIQEKDLNQVDLLNKINEIENLIQQKQNQIEDLEKRLGALDQSQLFRDAKRKQDLNESLHQFIQMRPNEEKLSQILKSNLVQNQLDFQTVYDQLVNDIISVIDQQNLKYNQELLKLGGKIFRKADIDLAEMKNQLQKNQDENKNIYEDEILLSVKQQQEQAIQNKIALQQAWQEFMKTLKGYKAPPVVKVEEVKEAKDTKKLPNNQQGGAVKPAFGQNKDQKEQNPKPFNNQPDQKTQPNQSQKNLMDKKGSKDPIKDAQKDQLKEQQDVALKQPSKFQQQLEDLVVYSEQDIKQNDALLTCFKKFYDIKNHQETLIDEINITLQQNQFDFQNQHIQLREQFIQVINSQLQKYKDGVKGLCIQTTQKCDQELQTLDVRLKKFEEENLDIFDQKTLAQFKVQFLSKIKQKSGQQIKWKEFDAFMSKLE